MRKYRAALGLDDHRSHVQIIPERLRISCRDSLQIRLDKRVERGRDAILAAFEGLTDMPGLLRKREWPADVLGQGQFIEIGGREKTFFNQRRCDPFLRVTQRLRIPKRTSVRGRLRDRE